MEKRKALPLVTVSTITYNQCEIVRNTILGLFDQDYPSDRYEIVVLEESDDGTLKMLTDLAEQSPVPMRVLSLAHEANYLNAKRWNQCIAASSPRTQVFIQIDDVRVRPDFILQHVKWQLKGPQFLITGSKFEGQTETWDLSACRRAKLAGPGGSANETDFFTAAWAASLSFSRKMMEQIYLPPHDVPYDARMTGWGFHEIEFAYRMKLAGATIIYDPSAGVFHQNHTAETEARRRLNREELISKGMEANIQYLLKKHNLPALPRW